MSPRQRMPVTPKARNGFQVASAGVTGLAVFGTLAATGAVAGEAARSYHADQSRKQEEAAHLAAEAEAARIAAIPEYVVVEKRRPHRTVVKTTVIDRLASTGLTRPSAGGAVTSRPASGGSRSSGSPGTATKKPPTRKPPTQKPPTAKPPPAPPAPSSGS